MAQFKDGDTRTINGVLYTRQGGVWQPKVGGAFGAPTLPFQAPQAQADLTGKNLSNTKESATLPYDVQTAKNNAKKSGIDVQTAQYDLNVKTGTPPGDLNKTGDAYLATLPPGVGDLTREMLAGKFKGSITSSRNPVVMQAALAAAHATDGNFDAGKYDERLALIKSLTDPNSQLGALNTALAHAGVLYDQAGTVAGGTPFGHTPLSTGVNAIENWWNSGSPEVSAYEGTVGKYGPEQAKAYGIGTGGERSDIEQRYSVNLPLDTKRALLANDVKLYAGKIASIVHGYDMLGSNSPLDYLSPEARAALQKIDQQTYQKIFAGALAGGNSQSPPGAPPAPQNGGGFAPPPTGPTNNPLTPSSDGFNNVPDPQSAQFWAQAAAQNVPYRVALKNWQSDVQARGLRGITPPPPDAYHKAASYIRDHPNAPYQPFSSVTRTPITPEEKIATDIGFSGPMVGIGHAANAAAGTLPTLLAGDQGTRYNAVSTALHPNWATAGDIAGTVAGAYGAGKAVEGSAPFLGRFGNLIAANPARTALTGDTLFMGGSGAAQNPDNPIAGVVGGAAAGIGGNLFGRYVIGPGIRAALDTAPVQGVINRVGGMFGGRSFNPPAPLDPGQNMLFKRTNGDPLSGIQTNLQDAANLGLPYMMADANPQLRALAGSAARKSPDVMEHAEGLLSPRQQGQAERAIGQLNNLAPVGDVPTMQASILKSAQAQSAPLYDAAKAQPVPELTANPQLNEIFQRPAGQAAIRKGWETALNNGEDVGTLTFATDPNGNTVQYGNPSWNVIHYARQALDANGETSVRHALDKQIAGINPGFKAADAKYAGIMKGSDALQAGADATKIGTTPETVQTAVSGIGDNLPQFQQGYVSNLADMIGRRNLSTDPYRAVYGSPFQRQNMSIVFPGGVGNFDRASSLEGDMGKTYKEVLAGSPTQPRSEADKQFDNLDIANDVLKGVATGGASIPYDLAMTGARKLANANQVRMSMAKANALAPYLFNPDPNANLLMLNNIMAQQAARKAYLQNFGAITGNLGAGMFGAPILYGASGQ